MLNLILSSLYFILPAYIANTFPVLLKALPFGQPISKRIFGEHKTWRGFYTGYLGALITLLGQFYLQKSGILHSSITPLLDYESINIFLYAFCFGIGAITGDLIKSFFKRRLSIKPGQPWIPFDQLDLVIGALVFISPLYFPTWAVISTILIITPLLHVSANFIAYHLKLKKVWW